METGGSSQGGSSQGSSSGGGGLAASGVAIAPDMSDIRTHTKAHLKGLAAALAPGARV